MCAPACSRSHPRSCPSPDKHTVCEAVTCRGQPPCGENFCWLEVQQKPAYLGMTFRQREEKSTDSPELLQLRSDQTPDSNRACSGQTTDL